MIPISGSGPVRYPPVVNDDDRHQLPSVVFQDRRAPDELENVLDRQFGDKETLFRDSLRPAQRDLERRDLFTFLS